MAKVTLQSQEWREVDVQGNETFGETLYINGNPVDKEEYGDATVDVAKRVIKALGQQYEILPDLEPMEVAVAV